MSPEQQIEQSVLEGKDREELSAIAGAVGVRAVTRMRKAELIAAILESIPEGSTVHVRTENLYYIDHSCLDLMHDWIKTGPSKNLRIVMESDILERKYREFATT